MPRIRVAAAALNQTPLDWPGNGARVVEAIERARAAGAQVLCLPELCLTGYGCEDAFHSPGLQATAREVLGEVVPATSGMIVSLGLPLLHRNGVFDCACLAVDGRITGFVAKRFLSGDGLHYEPRWFKPWPQGVRDLVNISGEPYPIGDLVFDCGGIRIGFEICEDAWVAARPGGGMAPHGVDVILNPSASHFAFGKFEVRKRLVLEGSRAFSTSYVYSNLLGNEAGRIIYDGGALIASAGRLMAQGSRFSYQPVEVITAVVDVAATRMRSAQLASFQPDLAANRASEVACPFEWLDVAPEPILLKSAEWESSARLKEEEFARAISLGLFDYLRKSRSHGFVVSLSGGADSSATACLVALMVQLACAELGDEWFRDALRYIDGLQECGDRRKNVRRLLHCVYQASENSSSTTRDAAADVAAAVGAEFSETNIDAAVRGYVDMIENAIGRKLTWETDDISLQNVQARARAPGVWLLANVKRALLLSTSNRSEAAVGYATMDGDTCGGLAPIAGIDKAFLRRWLKWLETEGPAGIEPIAALAAVNRLQPTAELRPPDSGQTDEEDLMPYPVLDAVERAAIRDKQPPREVFRQVHSEFPEYSPEQLCGFVERFFRLWCRNQWKRERYAPSFHVDDENLDPKTWCRFPILSGGFERELARLREYVRTPSY
ncbi:MAG: NAD(+) synthase [Thermoguttaceae bacterium]|jgi:NAD+ synthase (glutamine-hydrolysing)|nr:NAD(+) synthase [Thermoguttaceae bacterium]